MLKFFFSTLSNLSKQTALLESLDWSEEKLQEVMSVCARSISEMELSPEPYSSPESFRDKISLDLSDTLTEDQMKVLFDILNSVIRQSLEEIMSDGH